MTSWPVLRQWLLWLSGSSFRCQGNTGRGKRLFCLCAAVVVSLLTHSRLNAQSKKSALSSPVGTGRSIQLPFAAKAVRFSANCTRAVVFEVERKANLTRYVTVDLNEATVSPVQTIDGYATFQISNDWLVISSRTIHGPVLQILELPNLDTIETPKSDSRAHSLSPKLIGGKYLQLGKHELLALPNLDPVTGSKANWLKSLRPSSSGFQSGWADRIFLWDDELKTPLRMTSGNSLNPRIHTATPNAARRLAPGLIVHAQKQDAVTGCIQRITSPLVVPIGQTETWLRMEYLSASSAPQRPSLANSRFGSIKVELPDQPGFRARDPGNQMAATIHGGNGRRTVASLKKLMLVFDIQNDAFYEQIQSALARLNAETFPMVVSDSKPTSWKPLLANGEPIVAVELQGGEFNVDQQTITFSANSMTDGDSWVTGTLMRLPGVSPSLNWDGVRNAFRRHPHFVWWPQTEEFLDGKIDGIPRLISLPIKVTGKHGSTCVDRVGFVLDYQSDEFRRSIETAMQKRRDSLKLPPMRANWVAVPSLLPIRDQRNHSKLAVPGLQVSQDGGQLSWNPPGSKTSQQAYAKQPVAKTEEPEETRIAEIVVEPVPDETFSVQASEIGTNFAASTVMNFLLLLLSMKAIGSSRSEEDVPFRSPRMFTLITAAIMLALLGCSVEVLAVPLTKMFAPSGGVILMVVILTAGCCFARLFAAVVGLPIMLRLQGDEIVETLLIVTVAGIVPVGTWVAWMMYQNL